MPAHLNSARLGAPKSPESASGAPQNRADFAPNMTRKSLGIREIVINKRGTSIDLVAARRLKSDIYALNPARFTQSKLLKGTEQLHGKPFFCAETRSSNRKT